MSMELANASGSFAQFASNAGYTDLISAVTGKDYPVLASLFRHGATEETAKAAAELKKLAQDDAVDESVSKTAANLADLLDGQEFVIIHDGTSGENPEPITKRISGNSPISLNAKGRMLAKRLGERLAVRGGLDVVFHSPLPRAVETARAIVGGCRTTKLAPSSDALRPWRLGQYEGQIPHDVSDKLEHLIEHPDEVPPGKGADGKPGESFNVGKTRQLTELRRIYEEWAEQDPTLKIGVVMHSRGMELLQAWVEEGRPDDYETDTKDLLNPDDPEHADVLRWHKDKIKEIDLDEDDPLKPGVYLILHSLTDDDTDDGNEELQKYSPDQERDERGRFGAGGEVVTVANAGAPGHSGRISGQITDKNGNEYVVFHTSEPREVGGKSFDKHEFKVYQKDKFDLDQARGGNATGMVNQTTLHYRGDQVMYTNTEPDFRRIGIASALYDHVESVIGHSLKQHEYQSDEARGLWDSRSARKADFQKSAKPPHLREAGASTQRCSNCSGFDAKGHCTMYENYPVAATQLCDSWAPIGVAKKYLPPVEVLQAAGRALEAGFIVPEITETLAKGEGLSLDQMRQVALWFAVPESHQVADEARDAWGGKHAAKWATRGIAKAVKDGGWDPYTAVDLDGTLAEEVQPFDPLKIGKPVTDVLDHVKQLLADGKAVKIFTARVADDPDGKVKRMIELWSKQHVGRVLPVTNEKDPGMVKLIDDRSARPEEIGKFEAGKSVMISFWPDAATQEALAVNGGEPADQLHVTLAYLGKIGEDVDDAVIPSLESALRMFATTHGPVTATFAGLGRFPATTYSDGQDVAYLGVHSDVIQQFRNDLIQTVEAAGGRPKKNFGYTPHMTLKYVSAHAPHLLPTPAPRPVTFGEIVLSVGPNKTVFPLSAPPEHQFEISGSITKVDAERQMVFGWFSIVEVEGRAVEDTQKDIIEVAEIEEAAYEFVLTARKAGEMHEAGADGEARGIGRLIESVVFTKAKQDAILASLRDQGIPAELDLKCVGWWGGFHVENVDTWAKVKTGHLRAFSIGGKGKRAVLGGD